MKTTGFRTLVLGTPWRNLTYLIIEKESSKKPSAGFKTYSNLYIKRESLLNR